MKKNFTTKEFIQSATAQKLKIDNSLPVYLQAPLMMTMAGAERIRAALGHPMQILSGYRSKALNRAVGGVDRPGKESQHCRAEAFDFVCPGFGTPEEIVRKLKPLVEQLGIDQLIWEGTWVHVSFAPAPRYEVLTMQAGRYRVFV